MLVITRYIHVLGLMAVKMAIHCISIIHSILLMPLFNDGACVSEDGDTIHNGQW